MKTLVKGTLIFFFVIALAVWLNPGVREAMGLAQSPVSTIDQSDHTADLRVEDHANA